MNDNFALALSFELPACLRILGFREEVHQSLSRSHYLSSYILVSNCSAGVGEIFKPNHCTSFLVASIPLFYQLTQRRMVEL